MKEVLYNYDNLTKEDIDEVVIRTKGLLLNTKGEILLGYGHKTYQFPGGHLEEGETLTECLAREIKEETGIKIEEIERVPFEKITHYNKNYHGILKNRSNEVYYFVVKIEEEPHPENTNLDLREKEGNYTVKNFRMEEVEQILMDSIPDNPINEIIVEEMLDVLREYRKISKKKI